MEHFVDWKRQHSYAKTPLVYRNDESVECAHPPPLLMQKPVAAWALGGLGVLFLLVVGLVVRGGTMHGVLSVTHLTAKTNTWMEMLPTDVEKALLEVMNLGRPLIGDLAVAVTKTKMKLFQMAGALCMKESSFVIILDSDSDDEECIAGWAYIERC
ncbi:unnamed protein product [Peronospora belbahrii]|uniref:Uncharacterized protein n=1 Tax=Peronospora belbahrii TaxID=622444 RepID=A0AAU9L0G9_9STRA|nr:unnamed protein product [Peronospora belbahrii]